MKNITWTTLALAEYANIFTYLQEVQSEFTAKLVAKRIDGAIQKLANLSTGRIGRVEGTYEKVVQKTSYIVIYQITQDSVVILHIIHTARDWTNESLPL